MDKNWTDIDKAAELEGKAERKQMIIASHLKGACRSWHSQGFDVRSGKRGRRVAIVYNNAVRSNDIRLSYGRCKFDKPQGVKHSKKEVKKILQEEKIFNLQPVD